MKNIWEIFRRDIKRIKNNVIDDTLKEAIDAYYEQYGAK